MKQSYYVLKYNDELIGYEWNGHSRFTFHKLEDINEYTTGCVLNDSLVRIDWIKDKLLKDYPDKKKAKEIVKHAKICKVKLTLTIEEGN